MGSGQSSLVDYERTVVHLGRFVALRQIGRGGMVSNPPTTSSSTERRRPRSSTSESPKDGDDEQRLLRFENSSPSWEHGPGPTK